MNVKVITPCSPLICLSVLVLADKKRKLKPLDQPWLGSPFSTIFLTTLSMPSFLTQINSDSSTKQQS
ncbi:hypothetical protein BDE02_01G334300 [Populus trichocarpa]|nr:hypothetical protein BDE02_01G334300 [Populus trichocarpa]